MGSYSSSASFIGWKGKVILCKINDIRHSRKGERMKWEKWPLKEMNSQEVFVMDEILERNNSIDLRLGFNGTVDNLPEVDDRGRNLISSKMYFKTK